MSLEGIGAILGGSGAVASGFGGGGKDPTRSSRRVEQAYREDTAIQRRVKDARAAGVHPLFALGANVHTPPAMQTLGSVGKDAGAALRGVGAAVRGYARGKPSPVETAQMDLMNSQAGYYDALRDKAVSDVVRDTQPGRPPLFLASAGNQQYLGESLPVEGGVMPRRTYRSPMFGNIAFKKGSPTAQQREDEAGEIMGNLDSFVSYLNSLGRKLGIMTHRSVEGSQRKYWREQKRRRVERVRKYPGLNLTPGPVERRY